MIEFPMSLYIHPGVCYCVNLSKEMPIVVVYPSITISLGIHFELLFQQGRSIWIAVVGLVAPSCLC